MSNVELRLSGNINMLMEKTNVRYYLWFDSNLFESLSWFLKFCFCWIPWHHLRTLRNHTVVNRLLVRPIIRRLISVSSGEMTKWSCCIFMKYIYFYGGISSRTLEILCSIVFIITILRYLWVGKYVKLE